MEKKRKTREGLKHFLIEGYLPRADLRVREFCQECSRNQALLVIHMRLKKRYPYITIPPLGI
ncbi:MAG: hypothetical protein HYW69_01970, partial [Candidatus Nealsonbacteria bacterium]|nr:hypothetical protein [Candidatus Nealsonbacteria bacterium]